MSRTADGLERPQVGYNRYLCCLEARSTEVLGGVMAGIDDGLYGAEVYRPRGFHVLGIDP